MVNSKIAEGLAEEAKRVVVQTNYDAQILSPSGSVMASGSFAIDRPSDAAKAIDFQMTVKQSPQEKSLHAGGRGGS